MVKNLPANAGDTRYVSLIPGSRKSPRIGNGNPTPVFLPGEFHGQRGSWWGTVHRVANSQTQLNTYIENK